MKKNLIKKVFAVSLSIAMACPLLTTANLVTASAAAPYVSLRTTFKTLKVNQSTQMTLINNSLNWQVNRVTTSDRTIAMVYGKDKKAGTFYIKGKSEGRATVKAELVTKARKTKNEKTVACRVKVIPNTTTPVTPSETTATVTNQAELDTIITSLSAEGNTINKVTIATTEAVNLTIPAGTFTGVDLVVNAPAADITNNATFRSIEIQAIKADTWTENALNNTITVTAERARIVVSKAANLAKLILNKLAANVTVSADGKIGEIEVRAQATVGISSTEAKTEADKIPVTISAKDTVLTSSVPVDVTTSTAATVNLNEGAEKSTIKITAYDVAVTVDNQTNEPVTVTRADNTPLTVDAKTKREDISTPAPVTPQPPVNPINPGTTTTGSAVVAETAIPNTDNVSATAQVKVTTGSAAVVSEGSITATIDLSSVLTEASKTVSDASIAYRTSVNNGEWSSWATGTSATATGTLKNATQATVSVEVRIDQTVTLADGTSSVVQGIDIKLVTFTFTVNGANPTASVDGTKSS